VEKKVIPLVMYCLDKASSSSGKEELALVAPVIFQVRSRVAVLAPREPTVRK
jgi:hypothetical protein